MRNKSVWHGNSVGLAWSAVFGAFAFTALLSDPVVGATIVTFDVPGAAVTSPNSVNNKGEIAGTYIPPGGGTASFVRKPDGTILLVTNPHHPFALQIRQINKKGALTGILDEKNDGSTNCVFYKNVAHKPLACGPAGQSTTGLSINVHGVVAGNFNPSTADGFVWDITNGATIFGVPGATFVLTGSINANGFVTGIWTDAGGNTHGYIRDPGGMITSLDVPGASETGPVSINASGVIAGSFTDGTGGHCFVRDAAGTITAFDPPGSGKTVTGINRKGAVVGFYFDSGSGDRGFVRNAKGVITTFDAGGQTQAKAINDSGQITGNIDGLHGFVRIP